MAKKRQDEGLSGFLSDRPQTWDAVTAAVALRFNREYRRDPFELPPEVEELPVYQEWRSGILSGKIVSPFWELVKPQKNQQCLDIGCGVSFLIYPWREWDAVFYGQEISTFARDTLNARGPQLNSKLFKGVKLGAAHELQYTAGQFDLAIATGFSCYYPLSYWQQVLGEVRRVLKPGGFLVFDVVNPEVPLAENWAILETYLGAEVFLNPLSDWQALLKENRVQVIKTQEGEVFQLYKVKFN